MQQTDDVNRSDRRILLKTTEGGIHRSISVYFQQQEHFDYLGWQLIVTAHYYFRQPPQTQFLGYIFPHAVLSSFLLRKYFTRVTLFLLDITPMESIHCNGDPEIYLCTQPSRIQIVGVGFQGFAHISTSRMLRFSHLRFIRLQRSVQTEYQMFLFYTVFELVYGRAWA